MGSGIGWKCKRHGVGYWMELEIDVGSGGIGIRHAVRHWMGLEFDMGSGIGWKWDRQVVGIGLGDWESTWSWE